MKEIFTKNHEDLEIEPFYIRVIAVVIACIIVAEIFVLTFGGFTLLKSFLTLLFS